MQLEERPAVPFGGVGNDARWMARGTPPNKWSPCCIGAAAVDMPLSLAGDVVTLPWTLPCWLCAGLIHLDDPPTEGRILRPEWDRFSQLEPSGQAPKAQESR
jgi:hypothetical protein